MCVSRDSLKPLLYPDIYLGDDKLDVSGLNSSNTENRAYFDAFKNYLDEITVCSGFYESKMSEMPSIKVINLNKFLGDSHEYNIMHDDHVVMQLSNKTKLHYVSRMHFGNCLFQNNHPIIVIWRSDTKVSALGSIESNRSGSSSKNNPLGDGNIEENAIKLEQNWFLFENIEEKAIKFEQYLSTVNKKAIKCKQDAFFDENIEEKAIKREQNLYLGKNIDEDSVKFEQYSFVVKNIEDKTIKFDKCSFLDGNIEENAIKLEQNWFLFENIEEKAIKFEQYLSTVNSIEEKAIKLR
ncbi:hypothetical protein KQX54_015149 [Cotesia glomerata]|uniref:Uncharacterized protein n=1 Tax=Cotesia glomerata TaxID=32391 RepID=A0AAV7IK11_COTGL|nr:hypothetical protein KQX54_015149 [Cotesia glomerata]